MLRMLPRRPTKDLKLLRKRLIDAQILIIPQLATTLAIRSRLVALIAVIMPQQFRFVDRGVLLAHYARECLAICPRCAGSLIVVSDSKYGIPFDASRSKATCLNCAFRATGSQSAWFGPVEGTAKERCPSCGFKWLTKSLRRKSQTKKSAQKTKVPCPSCGQIALISIQWKPMRFSGAYDPSFGLQLWLQTSCCGETLWAYNKEHLSRLREYASATLREKRGFAQSPRLHWSVFSRLPKWVSASGNHDAVLACMDRLERKVPQRN